MSYKHFYTIETCVKRQQLDPETRAMLDKVVLGLRLVPTLGVYAAASDTWSANVGSRLRVVYRIVSDPEPQIVVIHIGPLAQSAQSLV